MRKVLIILLLTAVCTIIGTAQESVSAASSPGVAAIYLAKDDGTGSAGAESTLFGPTDVPIYCVVQLDSAAPVSVKMDLVAVSVPGVRAETKVVSSTYTTKDRQNRVSFTGKPYGNWVAGRYRADIYLDGVLAGSKDFVIRKTAVRDEAVKPIARPTQPVKVRLARRT